MNDSYDIRNRNGWINSLTSHLLFMVRKFFNEIKRYESYMNYTRK